MKSLAATVKYASDATQNDVEDQLKHKVEDLNLEF